MRYYVAIYIKDMQIPSPIPHAFLGLTHTHPDKLDKQGDIEIEKYKDDYLIGKQFVVRGRGKWYENIYPSSDEFSGEGFFGFGPVTHAASHWGKVYENNQ